MTTSFGQLGEKLGVLDQVKFLAGRRSPGELPDRLIPRLVIENDPRIANLRQIMLGVPDPDAGAADPRDGIRRGPTSDAGHLEANRRFSKQADEPADGSGEAHLPGFPVHHLGKPQPGDQLGHDLSEQSGCPLRLPLAGKTEVFTPFGGNAL